jgi:hypothetical protein
VYSRGAYIPAGGLVLQCDIPPHYHYYSHPLSSSPETMPTRQVLAVHEYCTSLTKKPLAGSSYVAVVHVGRDAAFDNTMYYVPFEGAMKQLFEEAHGSRFIDYDGDTGRYYVPASALEGGGSPIEENTGTNGRFRVPTKMARLKVSTGLDVLVAMQCQYDCISLTAVRGYMIVAGTMRIVS